MRVSKMGTDQRAWMRTWGNIAWWIVTIHSVPFAIYTVPFIYGKFEIYRYLTVRASLGDLESAGLHVLNNLRTWQIHAAAALAFVTIGPLQFNPSFRNKFPVAHKRLGYAFAACTVITAVTGGTSMLKATELGPIAVAMTPFMSISTLTALAISINAARNKDFGRHRRWMLRSAAIGYSVMYTRTLPVLFAWTSIPPEQAIDYSFPLSVALNCGFAELYIQIYLSEVRTKVKSMHGSGDSALADSSKKKKV